MSVGETQPGRILEENVANTVSGFIAVGMNGTEVGLFREGEKYFQTVKNTNIGMEMDMKIELSKEQFDGLWEATKDQKAGEAGDEGSNREIERKFLVKRLPEGYQNKHKKIVQGYMAICENKTEVRLREKGGEYLQTIKKGSGENRFETEIKLTKDQFDILWKSTQNQVIKKTRYEIDYEGRKLELDIYHDNLTTLVTVEVESPSKEESDAFSDIIPDWVGSEVTGNDSYANQQLALRGALPDGYQMSPDIVLPEVA